MDALGFGARFTVGRRARPTQAATPVAPVFDFTGGVLPPGASFARGSPATRFDGGGALVAVGPDVARFGSGGLLIEPAGSNVLPCSADWTDPSWSAKYLGGTADTLIEDASAGAVHQVRQTAGFLTYAAGQSMTMSAVARPLAPSAKRYLVLYLGAAPVFAGPCNAIFDLATGMLTGANAATAGAVAVGGGAWLCWMAGTAVAAGTAQAAAVKLSDSATLDHAYTGDAASGLAVTHVQIEPGIAATSRIVTRGSPATRAADAVTLDWGARGIADGATTVRYTFDDGSSQDVATTVAGGRAAVPTTLARRWLRRAEQR